MARLTLQRLIAVGRLPRVVISLSLVVAGLAISSVPALAAAAPAATPSANVACSPLVKSTGGFLAFPSLYEYITAGKTDIKGNCTIPDIQLSQGGFNGKGIVLILLAIIDILLRVAGIAALIYIVYGGIRYTISQGSPDKTQQAQSTLQDAIIGLVIALTAIALVSFIGHSIG